jgi:hypothetical protein
MLLDRKTLLLIVLIMTGFALANNTNGKQKATNSGPKIINMKLYSDITYLKNALEKAKESGDRILAKDLFKQIHLVGNSKLNSNSKFWQSNKKLNIQTSDNLEIASNDNRKWGDDVFISNEDGDQKAVAIDIANNGDIYAIYENNNLYGSYTNTYLTLSKSTDDGENWSQLTNIYSDDYGLFIPDIEIGEGNEDWIFFVCHTSDKDILLGRQPKSGGSWEFYWVESGLEEGIRPKLALDDDRLSNYHLYITYIDEDLSYDDVIFRRSSDFGISYDIHDNLGVTFTDFEHCDIAFSRSGHVFIV